MRVGQKTSPGQLPHTRGAEEAPAKSPDGPESLRLPWLGEDTGTVGNRPCQLLPQACTHLDSGPGSLCKV